jgi:hypothetical protein
MGAQNVEVFDDVRMAERYAEVFEAAIDGAALPRFFDDAGAEL